MNGQSIRCRDTVQKTCWRHANKCAGMGMNDCDIAGNPGGTYQIGIMPSGRYRPDEPMGKPGMPNLLNDIKFAS